jgi:hypothetical protein
MNAQLLPLEIIAKNGFRTRTLPLPAQNWIAAWKLIWKNLPGL